MNKLCHFCKNYNVVLHGTHEVARCRKATERCDEYGNFQVGATCCHDDYLADLFEPIKDIESVRAEADRTINSLRERNGDLRNQIRILEKRLTAINSVEG